MRATTKAAEGSRAQAADAADELREAMEAYKRESGRMFPTWCEVLEILRGLGYEKTGEGPRGPDERRDP